MNNDCKYIHETSLGHIIDLWDTAKDIASRGSEEFKTYVMKNSKKGPMANASSIARAASNLTMVFPVICTRNISLETASMISKAIEKNAVSMMQRLFASWQIADDGVKNFGDYLSRFHGNLNTKVADLDDVFRLADRVTESTELTNLEKSYISNDMRNLDYTIPDEINDVSLNDYIVKENHLTGNLEVARRYNKPVKEAATIPDDVAEEIITQVNTGVNKIVADQKSAAQARIDKERTNAAKDRVDYFSKQILDSDFKKANELMPTSMAISFSVLAPDGTVKPYENAIAAVKAKLYPISSNDIVNHISERISNANWITNLIRASTREISFVKDFALAIDKAKIDAMSQSVRNSTSDKMWKVLERRALSSKMTRAMRTGNAGSVAAITTLVVSQEEVEYLRKYNNIDLERVASILKLFESLNLMCVVIVDEALEVAKFIYDEQDPSWETISFTHLERESSDNTYKRVVNLMTKMS